MATFRRKKEALRIVSIAFLAGAHHLTEQVEKAESLMTGTDKDKTESRQVMLEADFERLRESPLSIELYCEILDEEELYPFGAEWPREVIAELVHRLIPPKFESAEASDSDDSLGDQAHNERSSMNDLPSLEFKFKKGFKDLLNDAAESLEATKDHESSIDHWMVVLLNTSFHAGMTVAARNAENSKLYYAAMQEVEEETEPWIRYPQLSKNLDKQLRRESRRRTGLVSDLDFES